MADSLDDFFAKKDKKRKNKNQSSVLSAETLVRELEEGSKQSDYSSRREGKTSTAMELLGLDTNDNDWKDFEEVEKRDYTGLKVKEMSIQDQEEEQRRLTEKTEQVPEIKPWKSKEDTVAAIISARDDVLSSELLDEADENLEDSEESKKQTADEANDGTKVDSSESAVSTGISARGQGQDKPNSSKTDQSESPETAPKSSAESKKDGDSGEKPLFYRPPHERLDKEVKQLEPVKLSKLIGGSRGGPRGGDKEELDIEDKKAFPTLG